MDIMTDYSLIKPDFVDPHAMRPKISKTAGLYCGGPSGTRSSGARSDNTRSESRAM